MRLIKTFIYLFLFFYGLNFCSAAQNNKIENIEIEASKELLKVTISLSKAKFNYKIDRLPSPDRLKINFKETSIGNIEKQVKLDQGIIKNIDLKEFKDDKVTSTEIIIEVSEFSPYYVIEEENNVSLQFENPGQISIPKKEMKIPSAANIAKIEEKKDLKTPVVLDVERKEQEQKPKEEIKSDLTEIKDIKVEENKEQSIIKIYSSRPIDYKMSELPNKHFLVLDIPYVQIKLENKDMEVNGPVINRIRSSQYQVEPFKIARIVIELKENRPYLINKVDSEIVITIDKETLLPIPVNVVEKPKETKPEPPVSAPKPVAAAPVVSSQASASAPAPVAQVVPKETAQAVAPAAQNQTAMQQTKKPEIKQSVPADEKDLQKLVSLDFKNADITNVLRMLSFASNINIVAGNDVKGTITIRVEKVPWDKALTNILYVNGFDYRVKDNIVYIAKKETFRAEEEALKKEREALMKPKMETTAVILINPAESKEAVSPSLSTEILSLNFANAKGIKEAVSGLVSSRGKVDADERTNSIVITETIKNIEEIKKIAKQLDTKVPQILIEAILVDVNVSQIKELGIQWILEKLPELPTSKKGLLAIGVLPNTHEFRASLMNQAFGPDIKILSNIKMATLNDEETKIIIGSQIPITFDNSESNTKLGHVGIKLKVNPHVTANGHIIMRLNPELTELKKSSIEGMKVEIDTYEVETSIIVKNGETVALGGLLSREESKSETGVPVYKRIPLLKNDNKSKEPEEIKYDREWVILVTPYVVQ
ncbi:AMIN domain-containing protein [Candidatus Poribacteria bacterium]|nr:AMIN domain-containing protein [Candidatus Poribacteria bacterium]